MSETSPKCNRCGAPLPPDAPEGLCPRCLVALNLATQTDFAGETGPHGTSVNKPPPAPPLPPAEIAKLFPQLEILECLGRGGMGAVYKARQPRLDRLVALKILSPEKQGSQQFAERFEREARALARLHHPNIVTVYDFGEVQGNYYLLMEFVDGLTLRQLFHTRRLSPPEALNIVPKICDALQYAHDQGVVHRDIKPENILLDKQGRVKIADFGIAKMIGQTPKDVSLTGAKDVLGTPHYMAPEQIEKPATVDHRADIYSLGVVFYEMLTGELPLGKFQPPSKKVQVDVRLDEVVLHALEKEPERRYQQASQVKTAVETIVGSAAVPPAQTADKTWQSPTMGWGHFIGYRFGITFTSPLTFKLANLSALGFLGALAFLAFVPLPGMHRCFGFLGFTGFFGLIGVAHLIELAARRKAQRPLQGRAKMVIAATVLSLLAILVGALFLFIGYHRNQAQTTAVNGAVTGASPEIERAIITISQCSEGDPRVEESLKSLRSLDQSVVVAALVPYLDSPTDTRRRSAIYVLWKGGFTNIEPAMAKLQQLMTHEETYTRGMVALALGQNRVAKSFDALANMTENDSSSYARRCAAYALGLLGDARAKPVLQAALQDHDPLVHDNAERALALLNRPPPSATAGTGPRIERVTVNADQAVIKGLGSTDGRIIFGAGKEGGWSCGFLKNTGFTATVSRAGNGQLNCVVTDSEDSQLLTLNLTEAGPVKFSEGRIVFHEGTVKPGADGSYAVADFRPESGAPLPITVRVEKTGASSASDVAPASAETWSPALAPGEKVDLRKILSDTKDLMEKGRYEDALQRHLWYFNHALEYDQGQTGVRLSFALSQWVELGRRYPKAKEALTEIRDRDARMLLAGKGYANLFTDVQAINRELQDEDATYELFKTIREKDPQLAGQCYFWVESLLVAKGEYQWCYDHMGDPQFRFDSIRLSFDMECANQQRMAATQQKTRQMIAEMNQKNGWTNVPSFSPPDTSAMLKKSTEDRFVGQVRQLIEILVATGHKPDAEKIRDQAVAVLDDARLKSAVSDTEEKIQKRSTPAVTSEAK